MNLCRMERIMGPLMVWSCFSRSSRPDSRLGSHVTIRGVALAGGFSTVVQLLTGFSGPSEGICSEDGS